jgi:hypothetical protein
MDMGYSMVHIPDTMFAVKHKTWHNDMCVLQMSSNIPQVIL